MTATPMHAREQPAFVVLLIAMAVTFAGVGITVTITRGIVQPGIAAAFAGAITVGEFLRVTLPGQREAAPLGAASALGYALLPYVGDDPATYGVLQVVAVIACATVVGLLPHAVAGRAPGLDYIARRIATVSLAAALFRPAFTSDKLPEGAVLALIMLGITLVTALADVLLAALIYSSHHRSPLLAAFGNEVRAVAGISAAIGATGVLIAVATGVMGLWAIPVLLAPLLLAQLSFRQYSAIRTTYLQTIRALSKVTELGGYTEPGHARRVATMATAIGREFGMNDQELRDLEYAALMHDIGQLSMTDPVPSGATVLLAPPDRRRVAELGSEVIRQTRVLDRVAYIVERQADPFRGTNRRPDPSLPLASRIIKVANAYDDLASGSPDPLRRSYAIDRLRLGARSEYDPNVVESLAGIIERGRHL